MEVGILLAANLQSEYFGLLTGDRTSTSVGFVDFYPFLPVGGASPHETAECLPVHTVTVNWRNKTG